MYVSLVWERDNGVMEAVLPYWTKGEVVRGFGRGSKQLGIPTANFPQSIVDQAPSCLDAGVYYGWACVDGGAVYKMVMSLGWNPQYQNEKKSMETHILYEFPDDFYGSELAICIAGYVRKEAKFGSLDELIAAIRSDIQVAKEKLEFSDMQQLAAKLGDFARTSK